MILNARDIIGRIVVVGETSTKSLNSGVTIQMGHNWGDIVEEP